MRTKARETPSPDEYAIPVVRKNSIRALIKLIVRMAVYGRRRG
jgi:hypothetical protein